MRSSVRWVKRETRTTGDTLFLVLLWLFSLFHIFETLLPLGCRDALRLVVAYTDSWPARNNLGNGCEATGETVPAWTPADHCWVFEELAGCDGDGLQFVISFLSSFLRCLVHRRVCKPSASLSRGRLKVMHNSPITVRENRHPIIVQTANIFKTQITCETVPRPIYEEDGCLPKQA